MTRAVAFHPDARRDVRSAAAWYERQWPGLSTAFIAALDRLIQRIEHFPEAHQVIRGDYRRADLRRFPYTIVFRVRGNQLLIVAVFHQARNPDTFADRFR